MPHAVQVAKSELRQKLLMCSPGLLWLAIMFAKPHKVTRPQLALSAGNPLAVEGKLETSRELTTLSTRKAVQEGFFCLDSSWGMKYQFV